MSLFSTFRPLIHKLEPEQAHWLGIMAIASGLYPKCLSPKDKALEQKLCGLDFPNPVGLAAGFDKNAETIWRIFDYGFGFVECGTVTPKAQSGNPKPRLFRIPKDEAVVNRLGFNNKGVDAFVTQLKRRKDNGIIGANIGKNKITDDAVSDYVLCAKAVYKHADYITMNISSPNTKGLRDLQESESLGGLIKAVHEVRESKVRGGLIQKPIFVKIAPDLDDAQKEAIADLALSLKLDGLIVSNTTISRPNFDEVPSHLKEGGLSGKPLMPLATETLRDMYKLTKGKVPLIGVGGIASGEDAYAKIKAGASLVQLYSALVFQGIELIPQINETLLELMRKDGVTHISKAIGVEA